MTRLGRALFMRDVNVSGWICRCLLCLCRSSNRNRSYRQWAGREELFEMECGRDPIATTRHS
jgi:hypothetical protein